jgi:tetratricopeptide (TPR) repeat protein
MPRRRYFWTLILFLSLSCSIFFKSRSDFEKGLNAYQKNNYQEAADHFSRYYKEHPEAQTTLYYLYDCYKKLNNETGSAQVLEQLIRTGSDDKNAYFNIFMFYRRNKKYREMLNLIDRMPLSIERALDEKYALTIRLYAEIICGATERSIYADPLIFAASEKYLPIFPNSKFYDQDTLTYANLIILLDRLVEPIYPKKFFPMTRIQNSSYLYLPYMRLVELGILSFNKDLDPGKQACLTIAAAAIIQLKKRGLIE